MPETKSSEINKELEAYKSEVSKSFNKRFEELTNASRNATNVWDRLELEHRIKEVVDLYKNITKEK